MRSDKILVNHLVDLCAAKGVRHIVFSPGSRNAPLIVSFNDHKDIECLVVADERCAGFFAIGIAQEIKMPVAICCTSGTAALNYAPAIAEAFYQRIPLLVITADRPVEWVNQGDGQTIAQRNVFQNYILDSYELPQESLHQDELWSGGRIINEAIDRCIDQIGPVHINFPLRENLYGVTDTYTKPKIIQSVKTKQQLSSEQIESIATGWNTASKKLILCGQLASDESLNNALNVIAEDESVVILTETTSNLWNPKFVGCIDRTIATFTDEELSGFMPDLLITIGGAIISKRIKSLFRKTQPNQHWHISEHDGHLDTYQSLTKRITCAPSHFFHAIKSKIKPIQSGFSTLWNGRNLLTEEKHYEYISNAEFSDLSVFHSIMDYLPDNSNLHMSNSTTVRYVQLFNPIRGINYFANRGTSGIDGSTSTAAGVSYQSNKINTLVTGDMSFFYDSNAFWNNYLEGNFKVILINNGGGGIFRIIPGPDETDQLEEFFETKQGMTAKYVAKQYNLNYYHASNKKELEDILVSFFTTEDNNRPSLLEVFTPRLANDSVLKNYFEALK